MTTYDLEDLELDRIDFVDRGASPGAFITLFKRHTPKEKPLMADENENAAEELAKRLDALEAEKVAIAKEAADAKAEVLKMRDENDKRDAVAKAAGWPALGKADEVGQMLYEVAKVAPATAGKLEEKLAAWAAQIAKSALFAENGKAAGEGDTAEDKLNGVAKAHAEKHNLTYAQAYTAVLKTPEGAALYKQMREEK